jgi:hypothetical protein
VGVCRQIPSNSFTGTLPTELGTMDALTWLYVCRPHPPHLDACAVTGLWAEWGGGVGCRSLSYNGFTGTMPTELGRLTSLRTLYASCRPPPCMPR